MRSEHTPTADFLKRQAHRLKKRTNIQHSAALNEIAKHYGYANWRHYLNINNRLTSSGSIKEVFTGTPSAISTAAELKPSFSEWLAKYRKRDSPLGDLAQDAARDSGWPPTGNLETYQSHLLLHQAHPEAVSTLNQAWKTYQAFWGRHARPPIITLHDGQQVEISEITRVLEYIDKLVIETQAGKFIYIEGAPVPDEKQALRKALQGKSIPFYVHERATVQTPFPDKTPADSALNFEQP